MLVAYPLTFTAELFMLVAYVPTFTATNEHATQLTCK